MPTQDGVILGGSNPPVMFIKLNTAHTIFLKCLAMLENLIKELRICPT
jgi:hypothetical protein